MNLKKYFMAFFICLFFVIGAVGASDNIIAVNGVDFEVPERYAHGTFSGNSYLCGSYYNFSISCVSSYLDDAYGFAVVHPSVADKTLDIRNLTIGSHDAVFVSVSYQNRYSGSGEYSCLFFTSGEDYYKIQWNGTNLTQEMMDLVLNAPDSNISFEEFHAALDEAEKQRKISIVEEDLSYYYQDSTDKNDISDISFYEMEEDLSEVYDYYMSL